MKKYNSVPYAVVVGALVGGSIVGCASWWSAHHAGRLSTSSGRLFDKSARLVRTSIATTEQSAADPCEEATRAERHRGLVRRSVSLMRVGEVLHELMYEAVFRREKNPNDSAEADRWFAYFKRSKSLDTSREIGNQESWKDRAFSRLTRYEVSCFKRAPKDIDPPEFAAWEAEVESLEQTMPDELRKVFTDVYLRPPDSMSKSFSDLPLP